jgi:hypothetical protein
MGRLLTLLAGGGAEAPFTPASVAGLILDLDFSDASGLFQASNGTGVVSADNDPIGFATDASAAGRHHTQPTAGSRPLYRTNAQNGLSAAQFDGVARHLVSSLAFTGVAAATAFLVVKCDADPGVSGKTGLWQYGVGLATHFPFTDGVVYDDFGTGARKTTGNPAASLAQWNVYEVTSKENGWTDWVNGAQHHTTGTNAVAWPTQPNTTLGKSLGSVWFAGYIGRVLVYNSDLAAGDRAALRAYLKAQWGTP